MNNYSTLVDALIQSEMDGKPQHEKILLLGDTPGVLLSEAGFPDLQLVISGKVISKACFEHGISTSVLKRLPEMLSEPKAVFRSAREVHGVSVVVLTFELKGTSPIVVPVHPNKMLGRSQYFNAVASVYGKDGPDPAQKWTEQGLLIWES